MKQDEKQIMDELKREYESIPVHTDDEFTVKVVLALE